MAAKAVAAAADEPEEEEAEVEEIEAVEGELLPEYEADSKSADFAIRFGGENLFDADETPLQKSIREQREKLGLAAKAEQQATQLQSMQARAGADTAVACDADLRNCMAKKCGDLEFSKCFNDSDTDWGMKMDSCRRDTKCTGEEYAALTPEIDADRKQNYELSGFREIVACGKTYNNCVRDACGNDGYTKCIARNGSAAKCKSFANGYAKCWAKAGGDKAIAACAKEFQKCQTADSGLQSRNMEMFAGLRVEQEKNIQVWEKELYALRDSMAELCKRSEGMLDERSLQCVYTVELFADDQGKQKQFSSRKLQSDTPYTCNPDWFGIDITTFKENAYRLTRSQTAASSAFLGAGVGTAAGALTSGAIGRAIDTAKAAKAADTAKNNQADKPDTEGDTDSGGDTSDTAAGTGNSGFSQETYDNARSDTSSSQSGNNSSGASSNSTNSSANSGGDGSSTGT